MRGLQDDISDIELKQRWRIYWIYAIFEFSNIKLQEMSWVQGAHANWPDAEVWDSSFEACISTYFDTLALDDAYAKAIKHGNVTKEEAENAMAFHTLTVWYETPSDDPAHIIKDPEWLEVVAAAKAFWEYLKSTITLQRELDLMDQLEQDFS